MQLTQKQQCLWAGDPQHYSDVERFEPTCHLVRAGPPPSLPPPAVSRLFHPHLEKQQLKQLVSTLKLGPGTLQNSPNWTRTHQILGASPSTVASTPVATNAICTLCHFLGTIPESPLVSKLALGVEGDKAFQKCFEDSPFTLGGVRLKIARL